MIWKNNRLADIKKIYLKELKLQFGENETVQLLNILIMHFFGLSRSQQVINPDFRINESEILSLHSAIKDLKSNKPIQYITGESEFRDLKLLVNDAVLIPRPETEELVELIINSEKEKGLKVLDIGTGSGCIAISLANELTNSKVFAIDISADTIIVARKNAELNNVELIFLEEDILEPSQNIDIQFDIIVSNPPYVTISEKKLMQANVLEFEPHLALFVDDENPLEFYKAIIDFSENRLKKRGRLYFEINEKFGLAISELLKTRGFVNIVLHKDINGKNRMISAMKDKINKA